uniref:Thioredoxin domain-containing protein n=1 Tax=viral metagenome TaxID=1070528 RepID=A0A6C0KMK1_9ZZZZ
MNQKKLLSAFSIKKLQKKINFLMKPKNSQKVLLLVGILLALYLVHRFYLAKEGFESSPQNLESDVASQKSMVLFYADWCGHCKKFMPEWNKLSSLWNDKSDKNVKMMKVNCGNASEDKTQADIMEKYNIKGYPTILVFENGTATEYSGGRKSSELEEYLNSL